MKSLIFLKLGGSLITDKNQPRHLQADVLNRLADEIASAYQQNPELHLLIGHGSGSFGHTAAKKYDTRLGVHTLQQWRGFAEVWYEASRLNRFVLEALSQAGLPAINFPPSAGVISKAGKIVQWDISALQSALQADLLPVVQGDVAFDQQFGGTIVSTEEVFAYLAPQLRPTRILLAGIEEGVWQDYPVCTQLISQITGENWDELEKTLWGSSGTDVTGGMRQKVIDMLQLSRAVPGLEAQIFSGKTTGLVRQALLGKRSGTIVRD